MAPTKRSRRSKKGPPFPISIRRALSTEPSTLTWSKLTAAVPSHRNGSPHDPHHQTAITACTSSSRAITLKWRKNAQVTGYEIRYTVGASSRTLKVRSRNTVKAVIRNPKKGRTYTIRLRAYRTVSGKTYYSAWSAAKKAVVR